MQKSFFKREPTPEYRHVSITDKKTRDDGATPEDALSDKELIEFYKTRSKPKNKTIQEEPTNNNKLEEDIKLLKNCINKTDVPKSIFKKEIDNLKNKLNEVSNKLFTKKVKSTIDGIKKTKIKKKSKYDSEKFTEGKNKIAQIDARLQDNNLKKNHKPSTKVKIMKKTGYEQKIKDLSLAGKYNV